MRERARSRPRALRPRTTGHVSASRASGAYRAAHILSHRALLGGHSARKAVKREGGRGARLLVGGYCCVPAALTPVTRNAPLSSFRSTVAGPRISLSPSLNAISSTLTHVILPSARMVDSPRNGRLSCTSDFCAAGSSV